MDEPKITYYYGDVIHTKTWYIDEYIRHRLDGPALLCYYENGHKHYEEWRINGIFHRYDGPAIINYLGHGSVEYGVWYINGVEIDPPFEHWPLSNEQQIEMKLKCG